MNTLCENDIIIYYKNNLVRFSFFDDIPFQKLSILLPHPLLAFLCILLTFCILSHTANIWEVLCPIKKEGHELYLLYIYKYLLILGIFWHIALPFTIMQQDAQTWKVHLEELLQVLKIFAKLKIVKKISIFLHYMDQNSRTKQKKYTNDPI